jgi:hypothetical protein
MVYNKFYFSLSGYSWGPIQRYGFGNEAHRPEKKRMLEIKKFILNEYGGRAGSPLQVRHRSNQTHFGLSTVIPAAQHFIER